MESQGFSFHTSDQPYWDETAYYAFSAAEIDELESATYALNDMCLKAAEHVVEHQLFERFLIPPPFRRWVSESWQQVQNWG